MRQVLQQFKTGTTEVVDVPCPAVKPGHLLIRTHITLISSGTERTVIETSKANVIQRARQQPDKVQMALARIKTDGLMSTLRSVQSKLEQSLPMGYCNAGRVLEVGADVSGWAVGDRVASNGGHAEVVSVPANLCARIPDGVDDESAAFTVLAAIALQGIRLAQPTMGECFVVTGLGLVGLLAVQLLRAQGVRVLGIDVDASRLDLARTFGAETVNIAKGEDALAFASTLSRGRGVDAVLITAATTSNEPVHQAAQMCRRRGRIVLVGVAGLELSRDDFYQKELTFQVSCSYGPGRYDSDYEEKGRDYPVGFVRWTEQRNFEAVLDLLAERKVDTSALVSHRFPLHRADEAYRVVAGSEPSLGILLECLSARSEQDVTAIGCKSIQIRAGRSASQARAPVIGCIGAGSYATQTLLPALAKRSPRLKVIVSRDGAMSAQAARKFGFEQAGTDVDAIFRDPEINAVVIATRHDTHARFVCAALDASKHVFVEKPLALNDTEVDAIEAAYLAQRERAQPLIVMVGFNRRFAPQVVKMKELLASVPEPKSIIVTVNAGAISSDHWTQDPRVGGGRIVGEGCHFVDLVRHLVGVPIRRVQKLSMGGNGTANGDTATVNLSFVDGSIATVHYFANGHKRFPKERVDVFCGGRILQLDNFRRLSGYGWGGFKRMNLWQQDKGHEACVEQFLRRVGSGEGSPIEFAELLETARVTCTVGSAT